MGELRGAEAQIEEINTQLDQFRRQLARLDAIDAHLGTLAAQLSDERLGRLFNQGLSQGAGMGGADPGRLEAIDAQLGTLAAQLSHERLAEIIGQGAVRGADLEGLADAAAQKVAARLADQNLTGSQPRDLGEVRGMLESFINERRHSDENNASMLETMQQAIIRVLDRIDALELGQQHAGDTASSAYMPPMAQSRPDADHVSSHFQRPQTHTESDYEAPRMASFGGETDDQSFVPDEPQVGYATAPFDLDAAFASERDAEPERSGTAAPPARAMDVLRHDFIADAHRAKLKAASRLEGPGDHHARMGEGGPAKEKAPPQKARARRSIFSFRSPRVLMCILTLLAMIPAALFFMPRTPADGVAPSTVKSALPLSQDGASGAGGAPAGNGASGLPANGMPATRSRQLVPGSEPEAGQFEDIGAPGSNGRYDRVDTAAIPDRLAAASGDMMFPSGGVTATPAALMQERVLRMNGVTPAGEEGPDEAKSPGLPPATVGPFSLRLAAAKGDPSAQFEVATRLAEGKSADQDLKAATQWYLRSATSGFAMAQFRLGTLYERGVSVQTDLARAKVWYARAAEQGNVKAMHNLAVLVAGRGGVEPDYTTAAKWFTEAANRGLADSQYNLAVLYENGLGVTKSDKEAYKWLLLAAKSSDKEAQSRRDALKARLSEGVRAAAEAMAQSWLAKPVDPMANDSRVAGQAWKQGPQRVTRR
jgi:localization factor PodJL